MVLQTKSTIIFTVFFCVLTIACNPGKKNMPLVSVDVKTIPNIHSEDIVSLISDSGVLRSRLQAKIWDMYSNEGDPYWHFPEGIFVEQYDSLLQVNAHIVADTAYYYEKKELWKAIGNVVGENMEGRIFETSELFWDLSVPSNSLNVFYTDRPVKITEPDGSVSYGRNGFRADLRLNTIRLFSMQGEFNIDETAGSSQQDVINADSLQLQ